MRKNMKATEALIWIVFVGIAAHATLWLVNESSDTFFDSSIQMITRSSTDITEGL